MKLAFKKTRYWRPLIAIAALLVVLLAPPALAVTTNWVGPSGNWTVPSNWDNGVPAATYDANLTSTTSKTATLNTVTPLLGTVTVEGTGGATFTLRQTYYPTGSLNATDEIIGNSNGGNGVYSQSAGSNTTTNALILGYGQGSTGTYNKSGGTLVVGGNLTVGREGTGFFNQSSTSNTVNGQLVVGDFATGVGTYKLSSGNLSVGTDETIGWLGNGTFTQSSYTHTIGGSLYVGREAGSTGTFTRSSGTLNVGGDEYIGQGGTGTTTQSSGTHNIGGGLFVGSESGSSGMFTMSSGTLKVTADEIIGDHGLGIFKQSSGAHTIGGGLFVGNNPGSSGSSFTLTSGSLGIGGDLLVASEGSTAIFTQTSGSVTVGGDFILGRLAGTDGTYTMTSGSLKVNGPNGEVIGDFGTATFNQTSGSNSAKTIVVAANAPATYNLTSGSVSASDPALNAIHINGPYDGNIPSATGGNFLIGGTATINGNVTNDGLVKTTDATVTWNGIFTNNSAYVSDPSQQTFSQDLVVSTTGYIQATHNQDLFLIRGDFINNSTQNTLWDTANARLRFAKGTDADPLVHYLYVAGQGATGVDNFAWRLMNITNQTIYLKDGNATAFGDQWLDVLTGATFAGTTLTNIFNADTTTFFDLWYDKNLAANAYLGGLDYDIPGISGGLAGGKLRAHTPLPPSALLLGSGLLGLGLLGWRRRRG